MNAPLNKRPPIISILGHIDHGKSTLQIALRNSNDVLNESGNITQHIGAYKAVNNGREATIIDTPGHKTFENIREFSINVSDIVLLVISLEDGVKSETKEIIKALKKDKTPFIVVLTKKDSEKNIRDSVISSILENEVYLEGFGGDVPYVEVSSKTREGIDDLFELIFLTYDLYGAKERELGEAIGVVIDVLKDTNMGISATIILLNGAINSSNFLRADNAISSCKIMYDDNLQKIDKAIPSSAVKIVGFNSLIKIGDLVYCYDNKKDAAAERKEVAREQVQVAEDLKDTIYIILKSDSLASMDSVEKNLLELSAKEIKFRIIKKDIGEITEDDVRTASSFSGTEIIGFHTKINNKVEAFVKQLDVKCTLFDSIYDLLDWANARLQLSKDKVELEERLGECVVIKHFSELNEGGKIKSIVGAEMLDGEINVNQHIAIEKKGVISKQFINNIEIKNKKVEKVDGKKTQFAIELVGDEKIEVGDKLFIIEKID